MTVHAHYHEISADEPFDMGLALGRAFGAALRPFLSNLSQLPDPGRDYLKACLSLTRQHFPDYVAELEGYATGAGVDMSVLWQMLLEDDVLALSQEKCTSLATNNGRLIGHNEDWDADAASRLFILRRKLKGQTLFELHYAGTLGGNSISISSSGTIQMINSLEATPLDTSMPRVPTNIIARYLADSADIHAAVTRLQQIPRMGGYAHTIIHTTPGTKHYLLELSQHSMAMQEVTRFPFAHANHYVMDDMLRFNARPPECSESSRQRYDAAATGAASHMRPEQVMSLLEDAGRGPDNSLLNRRTLAGVVIDLDAGCAWIRLASEPDVSWVKYGLDFLS
ncbi:MAG: C45 family autoproteolytic acyltransferase/hydrolase [Alphaproteobacteria bacterium]